MIFTTISSFELKTLLNLISFSFKLSILKIPSCLCNSIAFDTLKTLYILSFFKLS